MMDTAEGWHKRLAAPLLLAAFVFIAYFPSMGADFVFDDRPNIVFNQAVHPKSLADLGRVLDSPYSRTRPLALLTFALNHLACGMDPFGYHLVNMAVHAANAVLLYAVLMQIFFVSAPVEGEKAALLPPDPGRAAAWSFHGAALWAMNPVQTQAVTYIVQRMTSLATMFYLAAILVHLLRRRERIAAAQAPAAVAVFFLLGLGCKEIILSLPAALLVIDFCLFPEKAKKNWPLFAGLVLAAGAVGFVMNGGRMPELTATFPGRDFSPLERLMTQWRVLWHYLGLFVFPHPSRLHLTYGITPSRGLFSPWTTAAGLAGLAGAAAWALRVRGKRPLFALAVLFYLTGHAIEAGVVNLELAFIHRLYLPSLFLPLLVLPRPAAGGPGRRGPLLLLVIALFSFWTVQRNLEWGAGPEFWGQNIQRGADTARAWNNLAASLIDNGRLQEALAAIARGEELATRDKDIAMLGYNRGYALYFLGRLDEAKKAFRKVADRFGPYRHTILFLGLIELKQGRPQKAKELAERLARIPELAYQADLLAARIALAKNDPAETERLLIAAREKTARAPLYVRQRIELELVRLYLKKGETKRAYDTLVNMTREFPQNYSAWRLIHLMLKNGGDLEHAARIRKFLESRGVRVK